MHAVTGVLPEQNSPTLQRETELHGSGFRRIAGVDEAGRGPLAGPVVAGAVVLPKNFCAHDFAALNDSKKVSAKTREFLFAHITAQFEFGIGVVDARTIDEINIRQASWRAMQLAVADLERRFPQGGSTPAVDYVLVDGLEYGPGPWPYEAIIKGDAKSFSIAAASIIAKVTRDKIMEEYDREYSGYGFAAHKGYGTKAHLNALRALGPCAIHRRSFAPVRAALS
jgi:ribonuclease HII